MSSETGLIVPDSARRFTRRQVLGGALGTASLTLLGQSQESSAELNSATELAAKGWKPFSSENKPYDSYIKSVWIPSTFTTVEGDSLDRFESTEEVAPQVSLVFEVNNKKLNRNTTLRDIAQEKHRQLPANQQVNIAPIEIENPLATDTETLFAFQIDTPMPAKVAGEEIARTYYSFIFEKGEFTWIINALIPDERPQDLDDVKLFASNLNPHAQETV